MNIMATWFLREGGLQSVMCVWCQFTSSGMVWGVAMVQAMVWFCFLQRPRLIADVKSESGMGGANDI